MEEEIYCSNCGDYTKAEVSKKGECCYFCKKAKEEVYREIERLDNGIYDLKGVQEWIREKKLKTNKEE